jgi:hypothetical protein
MPFKSEAQRRFMHAKHPHIAERFEEETASGAKLPEHVQKLEGGGMACMHCGGSVDAEGYSDGGEVMGEGEMDGEDTAMREGDTAEVPQQWQHTQRMRKRSLADALASREEE